MTFEFMQGIKIHISPSFFTYAFCGVFGYFLYYLINISTLSLSRKGWLVSAFLLLIVLSCMNEQTDEEEDDNEHG